MKNFVSTNRAASVRAVFGCAITLSVGCTNQSPPVLQSSSEFELEIIGVRHYPDAEFGLGYAFAHGFSRVDLYGKTYRQVSPDVVLKSEQLQSLPIYKVVLDQGKAGWFSRNSLSVIDRESGNVLTNFRMPSQGWAGDQAGAWLAKLLNADPSGKRLQQFDVSESARVDLLTPSSLLTQVDLEARGLRMLGCPPEVSYHTGESDHGYSEVRTPRWTLVSPYGLREVLCSRQLVLVIRSHRQEDVEVIAIDKEGIVVARGFVRNRVVNLEHRYHYTKIVALNDSEDQLVFRQAFFGTQSPLVEHVVARYEVNFTIPWSAIQLPR